MTSTEFSATRRTNPNRPQPSIRVLGWLDLGLVPSDFCNKPVSAWTAIQKPSRLDLPTRRPDDEHELDSDGLQSSG